MILLVYVPFSTPHHQLPTNQPSKKNHHPPKILPSLVFLEQPTIPIFLCQLPNFPVKCVFFHHPQQPAPPEMSCGCPKPPLDEGRAVRFPRLVPTSVLLGRVSKVVRFGYKMGTKNLVRGRVLSSKSTYKVYL